MLGQANEYINLVHEGMTFSSDAYGTVFYLTTGFHGLHVIGGLLAFVLLIQRTRLSKFTPAQATSAIVVSYYWHFVDVVWIALFATIYIVNVRIPDDAVPPSEQFRHRLHPRPPHRSSEQCNRMHCQSPPQRPQTRCPHETANAPPAGAKCDTRTKAARRCVAC